MTVGVGASVAGSPGDVRAEVAELLGVSADTVDPGGNLISQGLDSIRMMALAGRWRRRGIAVDFVVLVADIFATRTVFALAQLLGRRERDPGRLDQVAELYLEVIQMDAGNVVAAIADNEAAQ